MKERKKEKKRINDANCDSYTFIGNQITDEFMESGFSQNAIRADDKARERARGLGVDRKLIIE